MKSGKMGWIGKILVVLITIALLVVFFQHFLKGPEPSGPDVEPSPEPAFNPRIIKVGVSSRPAGILMYAVNHYLPKNKFQVEPILIPDTDELWLRLAAGELDLSLTTLPEFVLGASRTTPGRLICFTSTSQGTDGILVKKTVKSNTDLPGKKIAVVPGSAPHFFLISLLNSSAHSTAEVTLIPAYLNKDAYELFKTGDFIDAAVLTEPFLSRGKKEQFNELLSTKNTFSISEVLVASNFALENRSSDLQQVVNAYFNLVDFIQNNPGLAKKLISSRAGVSIEEVDMLLNSSRLKNLEEARAPSIVGVISEMKKIQQVWAIEGLPNADKHLDFERLVTYSFMERAVISPSAPLFDDPPISIFTPDPTPEDTDGPIPPFSIPTEEPDTEDTPTPSPTTPTIPVHSPPPVIPEAPTSTPVFIP